MLYYGVCKGFIRGNLHLMVYKGTGGYSSPVVNVCNAGDMQKDVISM